MKNNIENYPQLENELKEIENAINSNMLVDDRAEALEVSGYEIDTFAMGSGGVGQVVEMKDHYRIQIGYGVSRHNYAKAVVIKKV